MTETFGRYISAIYADRFDSYSGQKLQVTGEQPAASGVMVCSEIVKANGEPVKVDYLMRRNGRFLADLQHLSRRRDQRGGNPSLRIRRHPKEPGYRWPDCSTEPQGRHAYSDHSPIVLIGRFSRSTSGERSPGVGSSSKWACSINGQFAERRGIARCLRDRTLHRRTGGGAAKRGRLSAGSARQTPSSSYTVQAQIQSAIIFGITAALYGEITLKEGRVEQTNFDTYQVLGINEGPAIEVPIIQSAGPPGGWRAWGFGHRSRSDHREALRQPASTCESCRSIR